MDKLDTETLELIELLTAKLKESPKEFRKFYKTAFNTRMVGIMQIIMSKQ